MFKNKKKVALSLLAATMLSSSAVGASSYDFANTNYNTRYNNYGNYYNYSNINQNSIYNKFNWEIVNKWTSRPSKPTPPATNVPDNPDYNWDNSPSKPSIPETPVEPSKPSIPETPAEPNTPTQSVAGISAIEMEVIRLVNVERQKEGLAPFVASSELSNVARKKSEDMAKNNYFSHTSPTYGSPFDMMKSFGIKYNTAGENIAKGQSSAQSVVRAWMNSSGHRANIMNPSFKTIGVGHYQSSNGTNLWTQMFTN